jgi:hypothetical protein
MLVVGKREERAVPSLLGLLSAGPWVRFVGGAKDLLLALWICRISVASAVLGFLLFWLAPRARDLFLDVSRGIGAIGLETSPWKTFFNTATFLLSLTAFWVIPVHTMARWSWPDLGGARSASNNLAAGQRLLARRFGRNGSHD